MTTPDPNEIVHIPGTIIPESRDFRDSQITPEDVAAADKERRKVYPKGLKGIVKPEAQE